MNSISKTILTSFVILLTASFIFAQDKPNLKLRVGGTVQAMASYAQTGGAAVNQTGFGLRRVRLRTYMKFSKYFKGFFQMEVTSPKLLDARITYTLNKAFNVRVGRFIGAGVRSGGLTSHTVIDIVERPMTAQKWGAATIGGDYRDYGVAAFGKLGDGFFYNVTIHNGKGAENIKASHKAAGKILNDKFAYSGMLTFKPKSVKGLEAGGYYGIGNSNFMDYNAYNAYLYWEPKPIRIKVEYIGWKNNTSNITTNGYYIFGAYGFAHNWELLARYENYDPNTNVSNDGENLTTIGARYFLFPSKETAGKITAAYVIHGEQGATIDNNVFYLMFQLVF